MKTVCQVVFDYINEVPVGDFVIRQELLKRVMLNDIKRLGLDPNKTYKFPSSYTTVDCYRKFFQYNNILSDSDGSGRYIKLHKIPEGVTFAEIKRRGWKDPLFKSNTTGIFEGLQEYL